MSVRPPVLLAVVLAAVFGCRRTAPGLDDVQRMTYGVKPTLVRVNAYATGRFVYHAETIANVGRVLNPSADAKRPPSAADELRTRPTLEVETGAGGSGSGFVVHPHGLILTSGHAIRPRCATTSSATAPSPRWPSTFASSNCASFNATTRWSATSKWSCATAA